MFARRSFLTLCAASLLVLSARAGSGLAPDSEGKPRPNTAAGIEQKLAAQIDLGLNFRNEKGEGVTLEQCFNGKPTVLVLAYYRCPMLCNQVLNGLTNTMRAMPFTVGKEFNVVVVSFDPKEKYDLATLKKQSYLKEYGREGAEDGWHFLTGDKENIARLTETVGFRYEYDRSIKEYNHASAIMIVSPTGVLSKYLMGIQYPAIDLRLALVEASEGKVGSLVEELMLMCYRFDHTTGKYSVSIKLVIRILGAITMIIVAVGLVIAHRRDRRKSSLVHPEENTVPAGPAV